MEAKRRFNLLAVVIGGAALALAACGSSAPVATLSTAPVAQAIAASIRTERHLSTSVACPRRPPRRAGYSFVCSAKLAVGSYPVAVVETNARGGVRYSNATPLRTLDSARIEGAIRQAIRQQRGLGATVHCPSPVLERAGLEFTCTATIGRRLTLFSVTEVGSGGRVEFVGR